MRTLQPTCFISILALLQVGGIATAALEETGWKRALETFEKTQARSILPVQQVLLSELGSRKNAAAQAQDTPLTATLETAHSIAVRDHALLTRGRVPHSSRIGEQRAAFLRAAGGRQWALSGTRNIKRIGLREGLLHHFTEQGRDLGVINTEHYLPGLFANRRHTDTGWTCYLFATDLRSALCLTASHIFEGVPLGVREEGAPTTPASPPPVAAKAKPTSASMDLLALLESNYRQKLLKHEEARCILLKELLGEKATPAADLPALRTLLQKAQASRDLLRQPADPLSLTVETPEAFLARLQGREWALAGLPSLARLRFDGSQLAALHPDGQVREILPISVEWPGLLRLQPPGAAPLLLALSPDLDRLYVMPQRSQFRGRAVE